MISAQDGDHNDAPSADSVLRAILQHHPSFIINGFFLKGNLQLINFDLFQLEVHSNATWLLYHYEYCLFFTQIQLNS